MAFTEFFVHPGTGSDGAAGSTDTDAAFASDVNGTGTVAVLTHTITYTAASGTPFASVTTGMWASVYTGATTSFVGIVTVVNSSTEITIAVDATGGGFTGTAPTAGSTYNCQVGGAWKTVQQSLTLLGSTATDASGHLPRCNWKNTGSVISIAAGLTRSVAGPAIFRGYTTSPGDGGRATIDAGGASAFVLLTITGANNAFRDLIIQNGGIAAGGSDGINVSAQRCIFDRITVNNVGGNGFTLSSSGAIVSECEAYKCNLGSNPNRGGFNANSNVFLNRCVSHDHTTGTTSGFIGAALNNTFRNCIADRCTGAGFLISGSIVAIVDQCDAYNCTGAGYSFTTTSGVFLLENANAVQNGTFGISVTPTTGLYISAKNVGFFNNNGDGAIGTNATNGSNLIGLLNQVNYASNPYTNVSTLTRPSAGNFVPTISTSKNAGRGALTMDSSMYSATSTAFPDIGAVQHQDSGGGLLYLAGMSGGMLD